MRRAFPFRAALVPIAFAPVVLAPLPASAAPGCTDYGAGAQVVGRFVIPGDSPLVTLAEHAVGVDRLVFPTTSKLWSFDITDRSNPVVEQTQGLTWNAGMREMAMFDDDLAYIATTQDSLFAVDFTTPATPTVVSSIGVPSLGKELVVDGSFAYLAAETSLTVLDLAVPSSPVIAVSVTLGDDATGVAVNGQFAYAATPSGLSVVKVQPTGTAHVVGSPLPVTARDVVVAGAYAYAIDPLAGLTVLDVSAPDAPAVVASLPAVTGYSIRDAAGVLYASTPFRRIDVSNPLVPVPGVAVPTLTGSDVSVVDDRAYFQMGLYVDAILDMTSYPEPVAPCGVGQPNACNLRTDAVMFGSHAFTILEDLQPTTSDLLRAYDLTDPSAPTAVPFPFPGTDGVHYRTNIPTRALARDASAPTSPYVFELTSFDLYTWDVSDPAEMVMAAQTPLAVGTAVDLAVADGFAYCAGTSGLQILDVGSPLAPSARGSVNPQSALRVSVSGSRAYLLDEASGDVSIVDVSNPDVPVTLKKFNLGNPATCMDVEGSLLYYVSDIPEQLVILDVSNPLVPTFAGSAVLPFTDFRVDDIDVAGTSAYVASINYGLLAFDVSFPASPTYAGGIWTTTSAYRAVATDDLVLFPTGCTLGVAPLHCTLIVDGATPQPSASGLRLLPPAPNPFRSLASLSFTLPAAGAASVRVVDVSGRQVRVLRSGVLPAGSHVASWDGRDDRGRPVGSGVYFVRLESPAATAMQKIVRLR